MLLAGTSTASLPIFAMDAIKGRYNSMDLLLLISVSGNA